MKYHNIDGSFSSFIKGKNESHSIWLTANAVRYLHKAQRYLRINDEIFTEALAFIASNQRSNGRFVIDDVTGLNDVAVTSFIGLLFEEISQAFPQYISTVHKAREFVEASELEEAEGDIFTLAISTYFMFQVDSPRKFEFYEKLSKFSVRESRFIYWRNSSEISSNSIDIATTAYGLLILDHIPELYYDAFKVLQWLLLHQNFNDRPQSSHSEIIAMEAISKFAARLSDVNPQLEIESRSESDDFSEIGFISNANKLIVNSFQVKNHFKSILIN